VGDYRPREEYGRIRERSYQRGGFDRAKRLQTTVAVGAVIMLLVGGGVGFAIGRATAPKVAAPVAEAPVAVTEEVTTLPVEVVDDVPTDTADASFVDETDTSLETTPTDTTPPPKPKQLSPANGAVINAARVYLRWSKVKDDEGSVTYSFEIQNRRSNGTYGSAQVIKGLKATSYSARVLSVRRRWRVWAVDEAGNLGSKSAWRTYIHKPTPPAPAKETSGTAG